MKQARGLLLFLLAMLYLISNFVTWIPDSLIIVVAVAALAVSLPFMKRFPQSLTVLFLLLGHIIFFWYGGDWSYWREAIIQNMPFVLLFVAVPLLSLPLRTGGYVKYLGGFMQRFSRKPTKKHAIVAFFSLFLTAFMNIGSLHVMKQLFEEEINKNRKMYTKAILQGFSLAAIFSPYIAGVAIVLFLLDLSLIPFIYHSFVLAFFGFLITCTLAWWEMAGKTKKNIFPDDEKARPIMNHRTGFQLLIGLMGLFVVIIMIDHFYTMNLIVAISLIALIYPFVWIVLIKKQNQLGGQIRQYWDEVIPNVHNESFLIMTTAFFSQMVKLTPLVDALGSFLVHVTSFSVFLSVGFILVSTIIFGLLGIHQVLLTTIYAMTVSPQAIGLSPSTFAMVLVCGWVTTSLLSPISGVNLVASNVLHSSVLELAHWNWKFVVCMVVLASALAYVFSIF